MSDIFNFFSTSFVCDEVEGDEESVIRRRTEESMTATLLRTCPSCSKKVVKQDGCNHMTCLCGGQFCYACRGSWSGHVSGYPCDSSTEAEDLRKMEIERVKGEKEREQLGVKDRKRIGGDA